MTIEEKVTCMIDDVLKCTGAYMFGNDKDSAYHFEPLYRFDGDKNVDKGRYIYAVRLTVCRIDRSNPYCPTIVETKETDTLSMSYGREKLISLFTDMIEWREDDMPCKDSSSLPYVLVRK